MQKTLLTKSIFLNDRLAKSFQRNEKMRVLSAPTELGAHIPGFWSTIGTYLQAKYEGQTPTELGERALCIFGRICSNFPVVEAS